MHICIWCFCSEDMRFVYTGPCFGKPLMVSIGIGHRLANGFSMFDCYCKGNSIWSGVSSLPNTSFSLVVSMICSEHLSDYDPNLVMILIEFVFFCDYTDVFWLQSNYQFIFVQGSVFLMYVWDGSKIFLLGRIPFSMHSGGGGGSISICFGGKEPGEVLRNGGFIHLNGWFTYPTRMWTSWDAVGIFHQFNMTHFP